MPDEIQSAPAADTSFSNSSAPAGAPAASGPDTSPNLADVFSQNEQTPGSAYTATPPAAGVPAAQTPEAPASATPPAPAAGAAPQGEGPQTTAPPAPDAGVTPPAGDAPPAPAPAAPDPQLIAAQQEVAKLRQQSEQNAMFAELQIHPSMVPAWQEYAKATGFDTDIRSAVAFSNAQQASVERVAQNEAALIAPYVNDGYSEEDAKAAVKTMQEQFKRTEEMLVDNMREKMAAQAKLAQAQATEQRIQTETIQRERTEAVQYASQKWGATELPKNLAEIFANSPAESIKLLADDVETLFQSRLASERTKWAAATQERQNTVTPMGANTGTSPSAAPLGSAAVDAPDLADIFNSSNNGARYAFA